MPNDFDIYKKRVEIGKELIEKCTSRELDLLYIWDNISNALIFSLANEEEKKRLNEYYEETYIKVKLKAEKIGLKLPF